MNRGRESIDALDGIRGMAALMVAFSHMGNVGHFIEIRGTGQHGVMLFFVLSGFLMSWLYGTGDGSNSNWIRYSLRRVLRVYPLYFVVIFLDFWQIWPVGTLSMDRLMERYSSIWPSCALIILYSGPFRWK